MTDEQIIEVSDHWDYEKALVAAEHSSWDVEAGEMIAWLNANAP